MLLLHRKDTEINNLSSRLEEEESLVASLKKKIKNLEARIEELEAELEAERQARVKVEKQRADLNRDLDDLTSQLDDTGNVAQAAVSSSVNKSKCTISAQSLRNCFVCILSQDDDYQKAF